MQVSFKPKDIAPQLLHVLILDLYELKPIKTKTNNKRGIRNKSSRIFPTKLMKKLNPKIGITIRIIIE
tara:strand:- start:102 stop:305 length:204 start_codon:yes stop_codon:yes gene_type:complete